MAGDGRLYWEKLWGGKGLAERRGKNLSTRSRLGKEKTKAKKKKNTHKLGRLDLEGVGQEEDARRL